MEKTTPALKKTARIAGLFYFLNVVLSICGLVFVSSKISKNSATDEMANTLLANEFLFRSVIFIRLVNSIPWILLALSLYQLLKYVNNYQAKLMFAWMTLSIPISFIAEAFNISGIMIAKGELLKSIDVLQRKEYAVLFLNTSNYIISISEMFWGLWLLPFGLLIYKSGFIPSLLGILLLLGGAGYIMQCSSFLLFPMYKTILSQFTLLFGSAGEITIMLWLLIKGVKTNYSVS